MPSFVRKAACGLFVTSILATAATSALADPPSSTYVEQTGTSGQNVTFLDDPLQAGGFGPKDARINVRPFGNRGALIRPRTQFVTEMLKTVENL